MLAFHRSWRQICSKMLASILYDYGRFSVEVKSTLLLGAYGRTDMRKSFDGLMAIIRDTYQLDPYANAVYLFCGRDSRKIKALYFDKTGFVLMQKRLDGTGRFQWPRNASEARLLSRQEFRWLMEGLSIDQPKAIRVGGRKKDF